MPFIVTVKTPCPYDCAAEYGPDVDCDECGGRPSDLMAVVRRAVAKRDDARREVERQIIRRRTAGYQRGLSRAAWIPFFAAALDLPGSGGTVGPLPDATLIDVERVTYNRLRDDANWTPPDGEEDYSAAHRFSADVIAAFNARHA